VIVEGSVGYPSDGGASVAGPGSLLGFAEAFAGEPRRHAVEVREPIRALCLDAETLIDILEDHPDAAVDLLCALASEVLRIPREEAGSHDQA
jgi:CRP-like cAMP-binding protein